MRTWIVTCELDSRTRAEVEADMRKAGVTVTGGQDFGDGLVLIYVDGDAAGMSQLAYIDEVEMIEESRERRTS